MPDRYRLRLPQRRVLWALAQHGPLTRQQICDRAGFSAGSGTLNYALNGMKLSKGNPRPHPGLLELGFIRREELDIDGLIETVWLITELGRQELAEYEESLPDLRDRDLSTNNRYKEE